MRIMADEDRARKFMIDWEVVNPNNKTSMKCQNVKIYTMDMKWQEVARMKMGFYFSTRLQQ